MDRKTWELLRRLIRRAAVEMERALGRPRRRLIHPDAMILTIFLYAVKHGIAPSHACSPEHFRDGPWRLRGPLPSVSQFNRRLRGVRCQRLLERVFELTAGSINGQASEALCIDGKALAVGPHSRDPDARTARTGSGWVHGYKLHAVAGNDHKIKLFAVTPMNVAEQSVAVELMRHPRWPQQSPDALVLADGTYDSRFCYHAAAARGTRPLTPLKGKSKKPGRLKEMGPARREAVRAWEGHPFCCRYALRGRIAVEQTFSTLCASSEGLWALPGFVRRTNRVRRWVGGKIIWHNTAINAKATPHFRLAA